ncbi:hypothetical protein PR202_gb00879 [Eleusine coracana subsp. coracana]|uniref:Uncharacterized protein n=1 Tax=Eleusine coracana subsp. coracana TaxID=191504 RepID=A0AAV5DVE1_ELECO|nr:hypothetical protein PR202_gb00879 [Eleusine coracana subsp. coracana]
MEDPNGNLADSERKPLSYVISDCVQRWFQDTYKQARAGDPAMMVLLAQMFHSGYGVPKNEQKAGVPRKRAASNGKLPDQGVLHH